MKNLENYGVLEMDAGEGNDVDGGFWTAIIIGAVFYGLAEYDSIKGGYLDGFEGSGYNY